MAGPVPKLVVIVGETGSGKSALGLKVAERFDGEIIAADSWTVRKYLDKGTAKPAASERALVPHHLLDIVEPCQPFTAAVFKGLALKAIDDIARRGKLPVMVGGTGLYIDSVVFDFTFMEGPTDELRAELQALTIDQLLQRIRALGLSTEGVDIRNKRRLMRLIETNGRVPGRSEELRPNTLILGLRLNRTVLRQRIERRVELMFKSGLKHEVRELVERYSWDCEGLKGIGYREFKDYFEGSQSLQQTKRRIVKSTLDLAKRQRTWFKRNRDIVWLEDPADLFTQIEDFLNRPPE